VDLATARPIVADSSRAPHQADWMIAGRVLFDHWQRHPAGPPTTLFGLAGEPLAPSQHPPV